jgi:hypothetical protein
MDGHRISPSAASCCAPRGRWCSPPYADGRATGSFILVDEPSNGGLDASLQVLAAPGKRAPNAMPNGRPPGTSLESPVHLA